MIKHAAAPVPVSPQAPVSCGGWADPCGQGASVRVTATPGFKVNRSGRGPLSGGG